MDQSVAARLRALELALQAWPGAKPNEIVALARQFNDFISGADAASGPRFWRPDAVAVVTPG